MEFGEGVGFFWGGRGCWFFWGVGEPILNVPCDKGRLRGSIDLLVVLDGLVGVTVVVGRVGRRGCWFFFWGFCWGG